MKQIYKSELYAAYIQYMLINTTHLQFNFLYHFELSISSLRAHNVLALSLLGNEAQQNWLVTLLFHSHFYFVTVMFVTIKAQ